MFKRSYSLSDKFIHQVDQAVRTIIGTPVTTERKNPALDHPECELSEQEKKHVAGLMRINHVGEICAQALYQSQSLTAKTPEISAKMERAAMEENDHLDWCEKRTHELGGRRSFLSPVWYASSFAMGLLAGIAGDKWSLGFVAETEKQVVKHLDKHLSQIPTQDKKTQAILTQMRIDELAHANHALESGGATLPSPIRFAMAVTAKFMTTTAYRI